MRYRTWTDQDLINAVKTSNTKTEVLKKLNLNTKSSGNFQTIDNYIKKLDLNQSHFLEKKCPSSKIKRDLSEILIINCLSYNSTDLKKRLIKNKLLIEKCFICNSPPNWQNKNLTLHLDHINGNRNDNRIENLRLLCPNCHSQTETYCRGHKRKKIFKCKICEKQITQNHSFCQKCAANKNKKFKIIWPPISKILELVNKLGYCGAGRILGISDNAIRKHIKNNSNN